MQQLNLFKEEPEQPKSKGNTHFCKSCERHLPESAFSAFALHTFNREKGSNTANGGGTAARCKDCRSEYDKGKRIALKNAPPRPTVPTPCQCCGKVKQPEDIQLDHDHITYEFRGWLCKSCNSGIGKMGDTIEGLEKGIAYLRKANE